VLPIPGLDPHSVTLELRSGSCRISNRMDSSISVGRQKVEANSSTEFGYGDEIDLAGAVVLSLEQADVPVTRSNLQKFAPDFTDSWNEVAQNEESAVATNEESPPTPKPGNSNKMQLAVIVFCFSMIPLMFIAKAMEKSPDKDDQNAVALESIQDSISKASEATIKAIASETDAAGSETDLQATADQLHVLEGFVDQLRLAKAYQLRGNIEQAKLIYDRLLKELLIRQNSRTRPANSAGKPDDAGPQDVVAESERLILSYIKRRRG
jgi:hypothetical protein